MLRALPMRSPQKSVVSGNTGSSAIPGARTDAGRSRGQLQPCEYLLLVDQIVVGRELLHEPDEFRVGENRADVVVARTGNGPLPVAVDAVVAQDQSRSSMNSPVPTFAKGLAVPVVL